MKKMIFIVSVLLCGLIISCGGGEGITIESGISLPWDWEFGDDINPGRFAPGISTIFGVKQHPTKFAQSYVLNTPYVMGQPDTGRFVIETIDGVKRVVTENAKGYDTTLAWPANKGAGDFIPLKQEIWHTTKGPKGNDVYAIRVWGTTMQKGSESPNDAEWVERTAADYQLGAGWPAVNWAAVPPSIEDDPDQTVHQALIDGYGYTFWVKPMKDYIVYRTAVENWDFRPLEGLDPAHWFGTGTGRDATEGVNFTPAPVGKWTQIRVIYDPLHPDFNMDVPWWVKTYGIQDNYPGDEEPEILMNTYDKDHSIKITFSIPLQHNGGDEGDGAIAYSVMSGRHEYDIFMYGLELLQYE